MAIHVIMGHSQIMTNLMCNCLYVWGQLNSNNIKYTTTLEYFKDYFIGYLGSNSKGTQVKKDQYIIVNQNCDLINDYSRIYIEMSLAGGLEFRVSFNPSPTGFENLTTSLLLTSAHAKSEVTHELIPTLYPLPFATPISMFQSLL